MLHHHLPPWATLKSRLKFITLPSKGPKTNLIDVSKGSRPSHFSDWDYYQGDRLYRIDPNAENELKSLKSANKYTRVAAPEMFDDDRIYLKQDPQQD